jgi:endonuclease YncB( thermonuclease family)
MRVDGALLLLLLSGCVPDGSTWQPWSGRVRKVLDGDTADIDDGGRRVRVRLFGVDAPEREQCGYAAAAEALRSRIEGRRVSVRPPDPSRGDDSASVDRFGRRVGEVFVDGASVNLALLREGHARRMSFARRTASYGAAEASARSAGRGGWTACGW